jgi:hypothetical protein
VTSATRTWPKGFSVDTAPIVTVGGASIRAR